MSSPATRAGMLLAVLALLAGASYLYDRMAPKKKSDSGDAPGVDRERLTMKEAVSFQKQISELKATLEVLSKENAETKVSLAELSLKKEELNVCNAELAEARQSRKNCEKWADDLDAEKGNKTAMLQETNLKLLLEKKLSSKAESRAEDIRRRLEEARKTLSDVEKQKEESLKILQQEKQVEAALREEMEALKRQGPTQAGAVKGDDGGGGAAAAAAARLYEQQLAQYNAEIDDLTDRRHQSDEMVRRLEAKLIEAGVDPKEIEAVEKDSPAPSTPPTLPPLNPALAAALQVAQGGGESPELQIQTRAAVIFSQADTNKDKTIDYKEFAASAAEVNVDKQLEVLEIRRRFRDIDRDQSGYITEEEASAAAPLMVQYLIQRPDPLPVALRPRRPAAGGGGGGGGDDDEGGGDGGGRREDDAHRRAEVGAAAKNRPAGGVDGGERRPRRSPPVPVVQETQEAGGGGGGGGDLPLRRRRQRETLDDETRRRAEVGAAARHRGPDDETRRRAELGAHSGGARAAAEDEATEAPEPRPAAAGPAVSDADEEPKAGPRPADGGAGQRPKERVRRAASAA